MQKQKCFSLLIITSFFSIFSFAQTSSENTGWFASFNSIKLSKYWGVHFDAQLRSADEWKYLKNVLIRPGIIYYINSKNNVTLGYAYVGSFNRLASPAKNSLTENRIWEQYIYNTKLKRISLQNRFRLEQRFIEKQIDDVFAQRIRYFIRMIIPLQKQTKTFDKGIYAALQNEIFFNIQNKEAVNENFFDQNRAYAAIGYRINENLDAETGYMNQYTHGLTVNTANNVIQLAIYTKF